MTTFHSIREFFIDYDWVKLKLEERLWVANAWTKVVEEQLQKANDWATTVEGKVNVLEEKAAVDVIKYAWLKSKLVNA